MAFTCGLKVENRQFQLSGLHVGKCREMSGNVGKCRENVGKCREMSGSFVEGDLNNHGIPQTLPEKKKNKKIITKKYFDADDTCTKRDKDEE